MALLVAMPLSGRAEAQDERAVASGGSVSSDDLAESRATGAAPSMVPSRPLAEAAVEEPAQPCQSCVAREHDLLAARRDLASRDAQLAALAERVAVTDRMYHTLEQSNEKLAVAYERLRRVYARRGTALVSLTQRHEAVTLERDRLRDRCQSLVSRVTELSGQVQGLQARERELNQQIEALESSKLQVEQEREVLDVALTDLRQHPPCRWALLATDLSAKTKTTVASLCPSKIPAMDAKSVRKAGHPPIADTVPRSTDPELASSLTDVGLLLHKAEDLDQAEAYLAWAAMILTSVEKRDLQACATALSNLGAVYLDKQSWEQAESAYRNALADYTDLLGEKHPQLAGIRNRLAACLRGQKRYSEAEQTYILSIKQYREALGPSDVHLVAPVHNLARLYLEMERYQDAATWLSYAMRMVTELDEAAAYRSFVDQSVAQLYASCPEVATALVTNAADAAEPKRHSKVK